jgi:hypothetical protein
VVATVVPVTLSALRRPRAFWISFCNVIGLACSVVGVLLLFWYALPNEPPGGPGFLAGGGGGPAWEAQRQLYDRYAHWGLGLVLLGTLLEAVPPVCTAIGAWRRRTVPRQSPASSSAPSSPSNLGTAGFDHSEIELLRDRLVDKYARIADQAAMIDDLRHRLDAEAEERRRLIAILTDRRAWWRRWFR